MTTIRAAFYAFSSFKASSGVAHGAVLAAKRAFCRNLAAGNLRR